MTESATITFDLQFLKNEASRHEEISEWINILVASKNNPTLNELFAELQTMYLLSKEEEEKEKDIGMYYAPYIPSFTRI